MKVLIVGNLGYVGPVLVEHLANAAGNFEVYGYDIGYFQGNLTIASGLTPEAYLNTQYYGDVRSFDERCLKGMDAVIYLAAISNDPMGKEFEAPTYDINEKAAVTVASLAKKNGVKNFVFASSCSVYGLADTEAKHENSTLNPLTAYAKSKINCEDALRPLAGDNFYITCLRFATACGISHRLRLDLVLNDFVASALSTGKISILSDGKPWRPLINVKDMALAMEWAIGRREHDAFLVVNTGSDVWNYQVIDLAKSVQKLIPSVEISVNTNAQPDNRSYKVDFGFFKKIAPQFVPKYSIEKTISELIAGLNSIHFKDPEFRNGRLIRLKTLNDLIERKVIDRNLHLQN